MTLLLSAVRLPHIPIFDKPSFSDTTSTCREYKPMALYGKVKPCPLHAHPVQAGCGFTAKPRIFCFAVQGQRIQFRRLSVNRSPFVCGVFRLRLLSAFALGGCFALGGVACVRRSALLLRLVRSVCGCSAFAVGAFALRLICKQRNKNGNISEKKLNFFQSL